MQTSFLKVNRLSQHGKNANTEVKGKLVNLKSSILNRARRQNFKFGENALKLFSTFLSTVKNMT